MPNQHYTIESVTYEPCPEGWVSDSGAELKNREPYGWLYRAKVTLPCGCEGTDATWIGVPYDAAKFEVEPRWEAAAHARFQSRVQETLQEHAECAGHNKAQAEEAKAA